MRISLNQNEILNGLSVYLRSLGLTINEQELEAEFTAGRKGSGISVDIVIPDPTPTFPNNLLPVWAAVKAVNVDTVEEAEGSAEPEQEEVSTTEDVVVISPPQDEEEIDTTEEEQVEEPACPISPVKTEEPDLTEEEDPPFDVPEEKEEAVVAEVPVAPVKAPVRNLFGKR